MKVRTWSRHLGEAFANLERNGWASLVSVMIITVTLVILGGFLLAIANLQHLSASVESQVEIVVFLNDNLTAREKQALGEEMKALPGVAGVTFISREEGLARLRQDLKEHQEVFAELARNPLPDSYRLRLTRPEQVKTIAAQVEKMPGVEKVKYGQDWVEKLFALTRGLWVLALLAVFGLGVAVVLIIVNTIRLAVFARRKEIEIMKLVGATDWFIRAPFLCEGILLGFIGGLAANVLLFVIYSLVMARLGNLLPFLPLLREGPVVVNTCLLLVVLGMAIGALGSGISVRKFLHV